MKAQFGLTGETHELHLTTEHPCSSYGQPVAVTEDGQAIDVYSWAVYWVVSATPEEIEEFAAAGYPAKIVNRRSIINNAERLATKLAEVERIQARDKELLAHVEDPAQRGVIERSMAGRAGALSRLRRQIAAERGESYPGIRERIIRIRLSDAEYSTAIDRAKEIGQTLSDYLRERLLP